MNESFASSAGSMLPIVPASLININAKPESNSSSDTSLSFQTFLWRWIPRSDEVSLGFLRDSFIGILSNEEAAEMRRDLNLFKKRFNDDFARKHQILFGH